MKIDIVVKYTRFCQYIINLINANIVQKFNEEVKRGQLVLKIKLSYGNSQRRNRQFNFSVGLKIKRINRSSSYRQSLGTYGAIQSLFENQFFFFIFNKNQLLGLGICNIL